MTDTEIANITTRYRNALEALQSVDEGIANIISVLKQAVKYENTVIIFTSDNGYFYGEHRLKREKQLYYDPASHLPLLIIGPGFPSGVTKDEVVEMIDLALTIVDLADASSGRTMDGRSLLSLFSGSGSAWRSATLIAGEIPDYFFPSTGQPAFSFDDLLNIDELKGERKYRAIRTKDYLYVEHIYSGEKKFYNGISQTLSRHNDPAFSSIINDLKAKLNTLASCSGNSCWIQ